MSVWCVTSGRLLYQFGAFSQVALSQFGALSQASLCQFGALSQGTLSVWCVKSGCSVSVCASSQAALCRFGELRQAALYQFVRYVRELYVSLVR